MARSLRPLDVYPITTRTLDVLRVTDVTPGMRRITLGGTELVAHTAANGYPVAAFRSDGFDDEGKLILKHPDAAEPVGPTQADGVLNWPRDNPHLLFRTYTIRRWDPDAGEIDLDFVNHGIGPATSWASRVRPGERVQWAGPKASAPHPQGVDWTLVAGDETALPAIGRWLEAWPPHARGQVFIEVAEASHRQLDLPTPDGVTITWLSRDGQDPGTTTLLFDAIRAADWWPGTVFAWVAGETHTLTPIRRWLRNERHLTKEQVEVTGYWRRQHVVVSEHDPGVQDIAATTDDAAAFHERSELTPGFALRVAATLGLGTALGDGERTVAELASAHGADPVGLGKLLRYLAACGITEHTGNDHYRLTTRGRELEREHIAEELDLGGIHAQRELSALLGLLAAIRPTPPATENPGTAQPIADGTGIDLGAGPRVGGDWAQGAQNDHGLLRARIEDEASGAVYVAGALAAAPVFAGLGSVAVLGRAAWSFAVALVGARPGLTVSVLAAPAELAALQRLHGAHERILPRVGGLLTRSPEPTEAVLLAGALTLLPDPDVRDALRAAAAGVLPGGRVLVFG
ncbi:siderophore-interacting protein, partial [Leucobacter sp. M11]|uniref:siderophore-interacting protein n=1 Tax=Leucobacter sp. M11 TaxID=2993565 RepID=UPI002D7ED94E